jgi:hypothetical protein
VTPARVAVGRGSLLGDDRAVVTIEALLALLPVLLAFLGAVQLAFFAAARLVVTHAAIAAARSAAVVLDDDPRFYGGEPRGHLGDAAPRNAPVEPPEDRPSAIEPLALLGKSARDEGRLSVIRRAAAAPLAVLAPDPRDVARWNGRGASSVRSAIGSAGLGRIVFGLGAWQRAALGVKVEAPTSGDTVGVRVGYLFHCAVPVAARLSCSALEEILSRRDDMARALAGSVAALRGAGMLLDGERFRLIEARASHPRVRALVGSPGA